jgi:hypothetical protein
VHDAPAAGHLGSDRTQARLIRQFFLAEHGSRCAGLCGYLFALPAQQSQKHEANWAVATATHSGAQLGVSQLGSDHWTNHVQRQRSGLRCDFVDYSSKAIHLAAKKSTVTAEELAQMFIATVFKQHGMPRSIVSDWEPRFTGAFWQACSDFWGPGWTCLQRTTLRPMARLSKQIAW